MPPKKKETVEEPAYDDDEFDAFDSPIKQPSKGTKQLQNAAKAVTGGNAKTAASSGKILNAVNDMKNLVEKKPPPKTEKNEVEPSPRAQAPVILNWSDIVGANDTNKHIIFKFMRKGFTSLSAEELACTMVNADFTLDFKQNTREDWVASYQFKVVERLNKCNFNLKWKTKSSVTTQGLGEIGSFFDLCKTGDIDRVLKFFRQSTQPIQEVLDSTDGTQGKSGLHYAVEEGQTQMVEYMINKGAKVDARDKLLRTPLHLACLGGQSVIAKLLIEFNADPYERDTSGRTSMHYACCTGSVVAAIELMAILVRQNTDLIHMKDHTGRTPLHYAVFNSQHDQNKIIEKLLLLGANINAIDVDKRTPLHFAAESGKGKMCQMLIQNGASVGIQDSRKKTPMDLAINDYVREVMIVSNPQSRFLPSEKELEGLLVDGNKAEIRKVVGLPNTDYYEPYQHAQPVKSSIKKKINQKPKDESEDQPSVQFVCASMYQNGKLPTPEMLCMNCRPLGTAAEWEAGKAASLPYNIRNYQAKLVENLRRVQQFGVDSYQHVKKPYMFTGSWMEYVRNLDDLMLQINGCRSNEAVLKVFNILFPYDKPLPRGKGDELSLANFYNDKKPQPEDELRDCHPDKLRENIANETGNLITEALNANRVEDINDLLHLQQQMTALQTANHMAMVTIEQKDELIAQLRSDFEKLRNSAGPKILNTDNLQLEEQLFQLKLQNEKLLTQNRSLNERIAKLESGNGENFATNDAAFKSAERKQYQQIQKLQQELKDLQQSLQNEKERNIQLRMKAGKAFMEALEDPLLGQSGGKIKTAMYCPEDDNALMRLMQKLDQIGGASLEQRLLDSGNMANKHISASQFDKMLQQIGTLTTDFLPLQRIAGYTEMQGNVKNIKVATIMARINDRAAMRKRIEEDTMTHIATYIQKRSGMTLDKLFEQFETDHDGYIDIDELTAMLKELKINVNNQLIRIILAIFDGSGDQKIDLEEFKSHLQKYLVKAPIDSKQIESKVINQQDAKELADMYNEDNRTKLVYEDVNFDYEDLTVIKNREDAAIQLIKDGKMPEAIINGEIIVSIFNSKNFPKSGAQQFLYVKLKRVSYNDDGTKAKQNPLVKICKGYDNLTGAIDQKIPILALLGKDKNRQADTMTLEFYMKPNDKSDDIDAVFFGECFVPFKQCFEEGKQNEWQKCQMALVDSLGRCKQMVKGQVNIEVRYVEQGTEQSSFNADGTKKEKKSVAQTQFGIKQRDASLDDMRKGSKGSQGLVYCNPKTISGFSQQDPTDLTVDFVFETSKTVSRKTMAAQVMSGSVMWMDAVQIAVNDTRSDVDMTVRLQQGGNVIATGYVPPENFKSMYDDANFKLKPFDIVMMSTTNQIVGTIKMHLKYENTAAGAQPNIQPIGSKPQEESKTAVTRSDPQRVKQINEPKTDLQRSQTGVQPSLPIHINDIEEDMDGEFQ